MEQLETTLNLNEERKEVPKNLKILCILSLIMGGLMVLLALRSIQRHYYPLELDRAMMQEQMDLSQAMGPFNAEQFSKSEKAEGIQAIVSLPLQILSIVSVMLMLKLKKAGFYMYVVAELSPYVCKILLLGLSATLDPFSAALSNSFRIVGIAWIVARIVADFVFIFLYSKQTKYMK